MKSRSLSVSKPDHILHSPKVFVGGFDDTRNENLVEVKKNAQNLLLPLQTLNDSLNNASNSICCTLIFPETELNRL